jgi:hypothetical protein
MPKLVPLKELVDSGFLFEINRLVLHPMGMAMMVESSQDGTVEFGGILDLRNDPEGFVFAPETFKEGSEKYNKFLCQEGANKLQARFERLGFIYQTKPEEGE